MSATCAASMDDPELLVRKHLGLEREPEPVGDRRRLVSVPGEQEQVLAGRVFMRSLEMDHDLAAAGLDPPPR